MPKPPSRPALTKTTTHDDGMFVRTAIVLDASKNAECGSIDIVSPDGKRICQVNITLFSDGNLILDTIDTEKRWKKASAFLFSGGERVWHERKIPGSLVSADFRVEGD